jgi:hypothetical protein
MAGHHPHKDSFESFLLHGDFGTAALFHATIPETVLHKNLPPTLSDSML